MIHDVAGHYIRQNHSRELPRHVLVLDTETRPKETLEGTEHTFRLGWSCRCLIGSAGKPTEEDWRVWHSSFDLLDYMERTAPRDCNLWVFANNVFFDLQAMGFYRDFTMRGWQLVFSYYSQSTYMLIIKKGRKTIKALSVSNYWAASTKELGRLLGEEKLSVDFETASDDALSIYCFRDTEIALDAMVRYFTFIKGADLGGFRLSRAAQAYGAWRHRFMQHRIYCHDDEEVRDLEQQAYTGGRVEAYRIGEVLGGPFSCYDVNSMYPFIMSRYRLPGKCIDYHTDLNPDDAAGILERFSVIAEVTLDTDAPLYAYRMGGKLVFPVGRFDAFVCTEGLRQALLRGHLVAVKRIAAYTDSILFRKYVDYFYELRQTAKETGDSITNRMAKLLMNSLYGKFAQKRPVIVSDSIIEGDDYSREEILDSVTGRAIIKTRMFHREIETEGEEAVKGAVIAIPAHITEYGRMLQYEIQEKIGRDRILYCDTDSIFVDDDAVRSIPYPVEPGTIGALSKKWSTARLFIYGAKDYETDSGVTLKGIPPYAEKIAPRTWRYTFWPGQRTHLGSRIDDRYLQHTVVKCADRPYDKGQVLDDGRVIPWVLPASETKL